MADPPREKQIPEQGSLAHHIANLTSYIFNPLVFSPVGLTLVHAHFGAPVRAVALTFVISAVFFLLAPLGVLIATVRRGDAETLEVRDRTARFRPFAISAVIYVFGALMLWLTVRGPARPVVTAYAALFPVNTALMLLITLRWKASVHVSSVTGFVLTLLLMAVTPWSHIPPDTVLRLTPAIALPFGLMIPLVIWARVRTKAHTVGEVVGGVVLALAATAELAVLLYWVLDLA